VTNGLVARMAARSPISGLPEIGTLNAQVG
jgi:hypothetical protein